MSVPIGADFPHTSLSVWCPRCGSDGHYLGPGHRSSALAVRTVPRVARCINVRCRTETFITSSSAGDVGGRRRGVDV